jgi:hypothetical protein
MDISYYIHVCAYMGHMGQDNPVHMQYDQQKCFFGSTLPHLIIDVAILCLPIWQVSQLRLDFLPKIGLCIAFAFGTL